MLTNVGDRSRTSGQFLPCRLRLFAAPNRLLGYRFHFKLPPTFLPASFLFEPLRLLSFPRFQCALGFLPSDLQLVRRMIPNKRLDGLPRLLGPKLFFQ